MQQLSHLHNTPDFDEIRASILEKILLDKASHFDVFFSLLSEKVYHSIKELAIAWIRRVARKEWDTLSYTSDEDELKRGAKISARNDILQEIVPYVVQFALRPTRLQSYTTRLLVRKAMFHALPNSDQDRIVCAELGLTYDNWNATIIALTVHQSIPVGAYLTRNIQAPPDNDGNPTFEFMLIHNGKTVPATEANGMSIMNRILDISDPLVQRGIVPEQAMITHIRVDHILMQQYRGMSQYSSGNEFSRVRKFLIQPYLPLPTWKRIKIGGSKGLLEPSFLPSFASERQS